MSFFNANNDEIWIKGTDDTWVTDSQTTLTLRADGTYTKQFAARVGPGIARFGVNAQSIHSGTYKRSGSEVHLSGDGKFSPYTENLSLFRKVSSSPSISVPIDEARSSSPVSSPSSTAKWGLLAQAIQAAPQIIALIQNEREARDKIVAPGQTPLKESDVSAFSQALALIYGKSLTMDEDQCVLPLLKQLWSEAGADEAKQAVLRFSGHMKTLNNTSASNREPNAITMFHDVINAKGGDTLSYWLHGLSVRVEFLPDALSASARRKQLSEALTLDNSLSKLNASIHTLETSKSRLLAEVNAAQQQLDQQQQVSSEKENKLRQLLTGTPNNIEGRLRQHFVRGRHQWSDLLIAPHIAERKLANNRAIYGFPPSKRIIALLDLTLFGSAKEAVVFCDDGFYFRTKEKALCTSYAQIKNHNFRKDPNGRIIVGLSAQPSLKFEILGSGGNASLLGLLTSVQSLLAHDS